MTAMTARMAVAATGPATSTARAGRTRRTNADSRLYRKGRGKEAKLSYMGPCADGEPEWLGRGQLGEPGDGLGRMPGG